MRIHDTAVRTRVSKQARQEIIHLSGARPFRFILEAIFAWVAIVVSIYVAVIADNIFISAIVILLVATRQNVLGLLIHEQTHRLGIRHRFGDWIANSVAGYPLLVLTVENYAKIHLSHHYNYFTADDPDFLRKNGADWTFPMKRLHFVRLFLRDLGGVTLIQNIKGKNVSIKDPRVSRGNPTPLWFRLSYFMSLAVILSMANLWWIFIVYWLLPLVTVLQVLIRWGALCEHNYGKENAKVEDTSPTIILRQWEKILLPNLNFTLHPYHHYYPNIPFANLPRVHEIFEREGLVNKDQLYIGYASYFSFLLRKPDKIGTLTLSA